MRAQLLIRMGDGERVQKPAEEVWEDLRSGTADAAERGRIPELNEEDLERLFDLFADPSKIVGVAPGEEVVVTDDACSSLYYLEQENSGQGLPMGRVQAALTYERTTAADTVSIGHVDYSFKQVKPIINCEKSDYYSASLQTTIPLFYGSQPNMGLYFRPDGPFPNPAELMPTGKIAEAREAQEMAVETMTEDVVYIGREMYAVGCEGFNLDTSGSGGDADFLAALQAVEGLKKVAPDMPVELGMASEFVLGMHGEVAYQGTRLAGLFPHEQVRVAEEAGVDIFGPAINVHSGRSMPWNLARTVTFVKETVARATIPVHPNVGMGVCGVPMFEVPPVDAVTRVSKALVQIGKADGL